MNGCNERDREVLLQFKEGLVDPSKMLSSWSIEEDCCKWSGVQCDNTTGRVNQLNLRYSYIDPSYTSKRLGGEINLCLLQLEFMNYLDLSGNDFTAINDNKRCLSHLSKNFSTLHGIDLSYNYNLQMENLHWLSCIPLLRYLDLSGIILERDTHWLQSLIHLSSLSELHLSMCGLSSLSPSLKYVNFTSLTLLDLSSNYFHSQIPNWLSNMSCLSYLDLRMNMFEGQIPNTLSNLRNLKSLLLGINNLSGTIPEWISQSENLQELDFSVNSFHGSVPSTLGNLSSLVHLDVRANHLNGTLPECLGQLSYLETLLFGANAFTGVVSESNFAKLSNLKWLDLRSSPLQFHIGNDWIPPFQLEEIFVGYCVLGPIFPSWLYTQKSIKLFYIPSTGISTINHDKFWSFMSNVSKRVDISNNSISGKIPDLVLNAVSIDLSSNSFSGSLPRLASTVVYFYAGYNSFPGPISPFFCGTHNAKGINYLFDLDLSYNLLSGELPECWMNWKNLHYVNLGGNNFTRKLPHSMGLLSELVYLNLGNNNLFGDIPSSLKNCRSLVFLSLKGNKLSGKIPSWIGGQSTQVIQMRSNEFVGSIPPQICQLQSLIILDLADNRLFGPIPNCLHNITSMYNPNLSPSSFTMGEHDKGYRFRFVTKGRESEFEHIKYMRLVDFSSNKLSGKIPPELFNLSLLQSLNLSCNYLIGKIPKEIGQMKSLESLDLSRNQLSGEIPKELSDLSFLSYLNLSFNIFTGKIPTGTQLQSFDASRYMGNLELCGAPLKNCTEEKEFTDRELDLEDKDEFLSSLYMGMGVGFGIGFWGVCAVLFFNKPINHAFSRFLHDTRDWFQLKMLFLRMRSLP